MRDPRDEERRRFEHPEREEGKRLLGVTDRGRPIYYDTAQHKQVTGEPDAEGPVRAEDERQLRSGTTVTDLVDRIEEEVGWEKLTDFAHEHLPGGEDEQEDTGGDS